MHQREEENNFSPKNNISLHHAITSCYDKFPEAHFKTE